jgi:hypothetical protein
MADQGQRRRITARVSADGETGSDNPSGQRLTARLRFPQCCPSPVPYRSSPSPGSCLSAPKLATSSTKAFFILKFGYKVSHALQAYILQEFPGAYRCLKAHP